MLQEFRHDVRRFQPFRGRARAQQPSHRRTQHPPAMPHPRAA
ncbi:hypothetical protein [Lysobacter gummosus]